MVARHNRTDPAADRDCDQLRLLLEEREREIEELRNRTRQLGFDGASFLSAASHAVMNPLTIIQSYLEILLSDLPDGLSDEQISFVETAHLASRRMRRIIDNLVELAALETGTAELQRTPFSLNDVVAAACAELGPEAEGRTVEISVAAGAEDLRPVGDALRITRVIDVLMSNAVRLTPAGREVSVEVDRDGSSAVVTVSDCGPGIPADEVPRLFEPFSRIQGGTADQRRGAGLGLAVACRLVAAHGGRLDLARSDDHGSTFRMVLPLTHEHGTPPAR